MSQLERRVTELERQAGYVADSFVERLSAEDAGFYQSIMRRQAASGEGFETFIRRLEGDEVRRLHRIHIDALAVAGVTLEDIEGWRE